MLSTTPPTSNEKKGDESSPIHKVDFYHVDNKLIT